MNCKHKNLIRTTSNTKRDYYCTAKQKEITEKDCKGCMLYNPEEMEGLNNEMQQLCKKSYLQ